MCGIAGILGTVEPADRARVAAMCAAQAHRGPDAERVSELPGAVLGHRRLSIIDLSDRALQPMTVGRHVLVFNGEIYNYRELRDELAPRHRFTTASDSEVLLAQLSPQLVRDIESLEPFGEQNPEPVLVATGLAVAGVPKVMGSQGNHISFIVRQGEMSLRAVGFGMAAELKDVLESGVRCSIAFTPTINEFRGKVSVELMLKDVHLLPDG